MGRSLRGFDVAPRTYARVYEIFGEELFEPGGVKMLSLGLHSFFVPVEAEPFEIFSGKYVSAGLVTRMVQIFHP